MTNGVDLAVDPTMSQAIAFREMASRCRGIRLLDDPSAGSVFVTDSADSAQGMADRDLSVVLVDPFDLSDEWRSALASSGRVTPANLARFQPSIMQVREALDRNQLGDPGLLRVHRWEQAAESNPNALAIEVDLALWIFGSRPSNVYGITRSGYVQAHLGFAEGGMALIDIDVSVTAGNSYYSMSVIGSSGAAYADDHRNVNLLLNERGTTAVTTPQGNLAIANLLASLASTERQGHAQSWSELNRVTEITGLIKTSAENQTALNGDAGDA